MTLFLERAMAQYWLMKSEPESYSFAQLRRERKAIWDGVRNYQARNNMRLMEQEDRALFYHSGKEREVVGEMRVLRKAYPDPTTDDERWSAVDVEYVRDLPRAVSLAEIKGDRALADILLVRNSRLSVMPISERHYLRILELAQREAS